MYTNDRDAYRQFFFYTWQKHEKKLPLNPAESRLITVILSHPEYHAILGKPETFLHQEFEPEENPFFHMSLHYALHEQIDMNRPQGISEVWKTLMERHQNALEVEHLMMEVLCKMMAEAQRTGEVQSDEEYLRGLRGIV